MQPQQQDTQKPLEKFGQDLTALAREGKLDPVIGRDEEIRRTMQILSRRTKNNPVLIGEPGVGKTAVVEGMALRITEGDVPDMLKNVSLIGLDMGLLEAGAGGVGVVLDAVPVGVAELSDEVAAQRVVAVAGPAQQRPVRQIDVRPPGAVAGPSRL